MKTVSLKLPEGLDSKLARLAQKRCVGKSEVIRSALEIYLQGPNLDDGFSCADLAGDLAGRLEGPVDLATNPKHLRDYGR